MTTSGMIKKQYRLDTEQMQKVCIACEMMPDDTDGVYTTLQDEGIYIEYEDLEELCQNYL